jgi:hypothetical protein
MIQLHEIEALNRSPELLKAAQEYRRRSGINAAAAARQGGPLNAAWQSAGRTLARLGRRVAGAS